MHQPVDVVEVVCAVPLNPVVGNEFREQHLQLQLGKALPNAHPGSVAKGYRGERVDLAASLVRAEPALR